MKFLISSIFIVWANAGSVPAVLQQNKIVLPGPVAEKLSAPKVTSRSGGSLTFTDISAEGPSGARLEIEITAPLEKDRALSLAKAKSAVVSATFADQPSPYEGELTNIVSCPDKFKPSHLPVGNDRMLVPAIVGRTTAKNVWGNCVPDVKAKMGMLAFFYDSAGKRLIRLSLFESEGRFSKKMAEDAVLSIDFAK